MEQSTEIWKPVLVQGFEGAYEVSSQGRVRSIDRIAMRLSGRPLRIKGIILKPSLESKGYLHVGLHKDGESRTMKVHSLVAREFLQAPPGVMGTRKNDFVVNHIDGNKLNNSVSNLEYVTASENVHHARRTGLISVKGVLNNKAKLDDSKVREIRAMHSDGYTQVTLAAMYGVGQTTISKIVHRETWRHVG